MTQDAAKPRRGRPPKVEGASAPEAGRLTEHELAGLFAEAWWAYDMAGDAQVRFDSIGRKWTFQPSRHADHAILELIVARGEEQRSDMISTAYLASDLGKPMIEEAVRALDKGLS
jgi:hypothetical protein